MSAVLSRKWVSHTQMDRPDDDEIIAELAEHFDETPFGVIRWLMDMDLSAALVRDQGFEPS